MIDLRAVVEVPDLIVVGDVAASLRLSDAAVRARSSRAARQVRGWLSQVREKES